MTQIVDKSTDVFQTENQKGIDNHKKIWACLTEAAKYHLEAAEQHTAGNHERAAQSTLIADRFQSKAMDAQKEDVIHHIAYK
jgi:hypothetical protein